MAQIKYPASRDLRELIRFSVDEGRIWMGESRMLLMHAAVMGALRDDLIQLVGRHNARNLMTRMGYLAGQHDADVARRIRGHATPLDAFVVGPQMHMLEGSVKVTPLRVEFDPDGRHFHGEFQWDGSWEAEHHVKTRGLSQESECWAQLGYASGYTSAFMNQFILFKEVQCAATGAPHCRILGKPLEEWDDAADYQHFFSRESIFTQLLDLQIQVDELRSTLTGRETVTDMVGSSPAFCQAYDLISRVAGSLVTVLLLGETGVGKERFARTLHKLSARRDAPFVAVNCAAIPDNLVESELFGVEKGAFTGSSTSRAGRFERADGGTLFLDEIGELPLAAQAKLLRVLQEGEVERLGDNRTRKISVRLITATNVDLEQAVQEGRFRADLFYRINIYPVRIPPLRERQADIPVLAQTFLDKAAAIHGKKLLGLTDRAMDALMAHPWPGNIREMENMIERGVILAQPDGYIELDHLFPYHAPAQPVCHVSTTGQVRDTPADLSGLFDALLSTGRKFGELEDDFLNYAVEKSGGNLAQAARLLGLTRAQLAYRLRVPGRGTGAAACPGKNG